MRYLFALLLLTPSLFAQSTPLTIDCDAVYPKRFFAAHGERAIIEGYSVEGLEAWVYPYQIFRDYRFSLRRAGDSTAIDSTHLLRRVQYTPSTITRIYAGPDFVLRETLFVPLDRPAILITFELDSPAPLEIVVHLVPVMDLMWPASTGGQSAQWVSDLSGFLLQENDGARALISSPQVHAHDDQWNSTEDPFVGMLGFTLHASPTQPATLAITADLVAQSHEAPITAIAAASQSLLADAPSLRRASEEHYAALLRSSLQVETPESTVNSALQWATVALDQSWVCNTDLGCAMVAGYGPSRRARRPQYQWFFAGDGLIGTEALLDLGEFARARQELGFILKYQDAASGMIWHELTQSARHLDWAGKFPYMYVHVDLSFQFLAEIEHYVERTGDIEFIHQHWKQIDAAYRYCESTIDPATHLPRIPESKSGGNEQDRLADELSLSTAWVEAANAYSEMASLVGDHDSSAQANVAASAASKALIRRYWDPESGFFISAYTHDGRSAPGRTLSAANKLLLDSPYLAGENARSVLDQLASADFQTDWGTRSMAPSSTFAPATYSKGSVSPLATGGVAQLFWDLHRPWTAEGIWRTLLPGQSLDALGHLPEVYSGSVYREQEESVPEQMWSTASLIEATVEGLLGIRADALTTERKIPTLHFAPRLPANWDFIHIRNLAIGERTLNLELRSSPRQMELQIENSGSDGLPLDFRPLLPLGASIQAVSFQGKELPYSPSVPSSGKLLESRPEMVLAVPHGISHLVIRYRGGVSLLSQPASVQVGDRSHLYKLRSAELDGQRLVFHLDVPSGRPSTLFLRSAAPLVHPMGGHLEAGPEPFVWKLILDPVPGPLHQFRAVEASVELSDY
jgi:glycogen debranching enzyme